MNSPLTLNGRCVLRRRRVLLGEFYSVNKARTIRCQKDDGLGDLIALAGRLAGGLSGQWFAPIPHRPRALGSCRSGPHCIHADTTRAYSAAQALVRRLKHVHFVPASKSAWNFPNE